MKVLMMPDYRADNPYQALLSDSMFSKGVQVEFPQGYRRIFPVWRALKQSAGSFHLLHLHWTNPYLKGNTFVVKLVYALKFLTDIWLVKLSGVRIVWTVHNIVSHESRFPGLECWIHQRLAKSCDHIIVHHKNACEQVLYHYRADYKKVSIIPHGHYRAAYGRAIDQITARQQLGLPLNGNLYLTFGMLRPYKGIESLLQAWQAVQFHQSTLLIAGQPRDEAYGQTLSTAVSEINNVALHDRFIKDEDISAYFSAADVVILPFQQVSTSGSLLLAMSYNTPAIVPCLGGIAETLGDADWLLYEFEDEDGLLRAIKKSLKIDLEALGQLVKKESDLLSWDSIAQKIKILYQQAIESCP